jgi:hypothetical protein
MSLELLEPRSTRLKQNRAFKCSKCQKPAYSHFQALKSIFKSKSGSMSLSYAPRDQNSSQEQAYMHIKPINMSSQASNPS